MKLLFQSINAEEKNLAGLNTSQWIGLCVITYALSAALLVIYSAYSSVLM